MRSWRRIGALLLAITLLHPSTAAAADGCIQIADQDWWAPTAGSPDPSQPSHVHLDMDCLPTGAVSGVVNVTLTGLWHNNAGKVTRWKFQDDGSKFEIVDKTAFTPALNVPFTHTFTIDTAKHANSGWRLWRFYLYVTQPDGNTQIARLIVPVFVANGKARKDANATWVKPTGWYHDLSPATDSGYVQAAFKRTDIPLAPVSGPFSIGISCSVNGGASPSRTEAYLDPSFHDSVPDVPFFSKSGGYKGNLAVPDLSPGDHRIVLVCQQSLSNDRLHAGVGALGVTAQ